MTPPAVQTYGHYGQNATVFIARPERARFKSLGNACLIPPSFLLFAEALSYAIAPTAPLDDSAGRTWKYQLGLKSTPIRFLWRGKKLRRMEQENRSKPKPYSDQ